MSMMGVAPPDIPRPANLQPVWSAFPMREMPKNREFMQLGLDLILDPEYIAFNEENTN